MDERDLAKGGVKMDYTQRASIMSKLAGGTASDMVKNSSVPIDNSTTSIRISNMFDPIVESEDGWSEDVRADALEECSKYGTVLLCRLDSKSKNGNVYVKFASPESSANASIATHNRVFDGRHLHVVSLTEDELQESLKNI
jgi:RNA-binding protein 39